MKLISSRVYVCLMMFFALFCSAQSAMADNKLTVEPFSMTGEGPVNVPVMLENSDAITQLQFDVVLPSFLVIDKSGPIKNNDRLTQHQLRFQPIAGDAEHNHYRIVVYSISGEAIEGNSGEILALPITLDSNTANGDAVMTIENIVMTDAAAQTINAPSVTVEVSMLNAVISAEPTQLVVNPGATQDLTIALENNFNVYGVEFDIVVPEGFSIDTKNYVISDRCADEAAPMLKYIDKVGVYRFLLSGLTADYLIKEGTGTVLTVKVAAPEGFTEGTAEIAVKNCVLSALPDPSDYTNVVGVNCADITVPVVSGKAALDKANEVVDGLKEALAAALETIETECPDVKDDYTGEEITTAINLLDQAVQDAYADGSLTPNYDEIMAPAEGISNDIDALVSDAVAAQAAYVEANRKAANEAAYNAVIEALDELQAEIDETKADIAKEYPGVDVSSYINKAQEELDAIRKAADEAYEAVETEGMFKFEYDSEPIETALADAKDQASRLSTAEGAYAEAVSQLDALQEQLNITKTVVAVQYPGVDVTAKTKAAQAAIDDARKAAKDALEAAQTEGAFEYEVPVDEITAAINAIPAEAKRLVDNEAAYKADVKTIDQLEKKLDAAYDQVVVDFPEVSLDELKPAYDAAKDAVDAARAAANEAYAAVISEGDYDYEVPVDEIEALIKEIRIAAENAGLNDITVDALPEDFRMFNLQGVEVENPAPGSVVIIRNNKGVSRKVLVM